MPGRIDPWLLACLLLSAVLLFWGLDDRCLWQDEAETALLARNTLEHGLPIAFDGKNLISQELGHDSDPAWGYVWRWSSWLPIGLSAASMAVLGPTTFAARLPFAILGWLTILGVYALARRLFDCVWVGRVASFLLITSPHFLLHARQARWYALAYFTVVLFLWAVWRLQEGRRFGALGVALAAVCLFHTNYFIALGLVPAGLAAAVLLSREWSQRRSLLYTAGLTVLLFLPGLWLYAVFGKAGGLDWVGFGASLLTYAGSFFTFLLPLPAMALLVIFLCRKGDDDPSNLEWRRSALWLLGLAVLFVCYLSLAPWLFFRYLSVLLPLVSMLLAFVVVRLWRTRHVLSAALLIVLVGSDFLHRAPLAWSGFHGSEVSDRFPSMGPIGFPLAGFLCERLDPPVDPEWVIAEHLREHAGADETIAITYGDLPLQFYTELRVVGGLQGQPLPTRPDWIVIRAAAVTKRRGGDKDVARFIQKHVERSDYEIVLLPCPDLLLANNPDPFYHRYRVRAEDAPPVALLRRKQRQ